MIDQARLRRAIEEALRLALPDVSPGQLTDSYHAIMDRLEADGFVLRPDLLTGDESAVLQKLALAWSAFVDLPRCHPTELQEGATFVHGLQTLVMVRAAVRAYPETFTHVPDFK